MHAQLHTGKQLEQRQHQQRQPRAHHCPAGSRLRLNAFLLLRDGNERKINAAEGQHVPELHDRQLRRLSVDQHASGGACVHDGPAAVVIARQHRVRARNRRVFQRHIAALSPPDQALPVHDGDTVAGGSCEPRPDLRLAPEQQQRLSAPQQNHERQQRKDIAQRAVQRQKRRRRFDGIQKGFQRLLHDTLLFGFKRSRCKRSSLRLSKKLTLF